MLTKKPCNRAVLAIGLLLMLGLVACEDEGGSDGSCTAFTNDEFAAVLDIDVAFFSQTSLGVCYEDDVLGEGARARGGDTVGVGYAGWLTNGVGFDSGSFDFTLNAGSAIAGFNDGVKGMRVGGRRTILIPSELGYGASGDGGIPPNATLVFGILLDEIIE